MIVFFSSYNLKMNNPKKIYEINVSTREPNTRQICAGSYEYSLSEYINFPEWANTYVGVRDVQPPGVSATLTCSVNMFHILEKYDEKLVKNKDVLFCSMEELCTKLEALAYNSIGNFYLPSLDYTMAGQDPVISAQPAISFSFEQHLCVVKKHPNLLLVISANLARYLRLYDAIISMYDEADTAGRSRDELIQSYNQLVKLQDCYYVGNDYCYMVPPKNLTLHLAVFDMVDCFTLTNNGMRVPILFSIDMKNKHEKLSDFECRTELMSMKPVAVSFLKTIKFKILDKNMQIVNGCDSNLVMNDFEFKLVFYCF